MGESVLPGCVRLRVAGALGLFTRDYFPGALDAPPNRVPKPGAAGYFLELLVGELNALLSDVGHCLVGALALGETL